MKDSGDNNKHDEKDELWELLGRGPQPPQASPFFARNVIRGIRSSPARSPWFVLFRPLAASAAVLIAGVMVYQAFVTPEQGHETTAYVPPDVELIEEFDNLIAYSH